MKLAVPMSSPAITVAVYRSDGAAIVMMTVVIVVTNKIVRQLLALRLTSSVPTMFAYRLGGSAMENQTAQTDQMNW